MRRIKQLPYTWYAFVVFLEISAATGLNSVVMLCPFRFAPAYRTVARLSLDLSALLSVSGVCRAAIMPQGADGEPTHFTDKIEINDYPQQVRRVNMPGSLFRRS